MKNSHHSHRLSIIAAIGRNRELGKDNRLLWHIPEDLKRFKKLTANHVVIMGRKTFESIGRPLPNRTNIVVTRNSSFNPTGCIMVGSLKQALEKAKELEKNGEIFIIGGASIYQQSMAIADRLYLTIIDQDFPIADVFFPDYSEFTTVKLSQQYESQGFKYTFLELEK